ncbi:MAG: hypothetical protein ACFFFT_16055 [Candidatus Thorarchaeota archaeon]
MNREEIIKKILEVNNYWTRDYLNSLINDRIEIYSGFISEEGALRLIAQDLRIELDDGKNFGNSVPIRELVPDIYDVNVIGRVSVIWPIKKFIKKDGSKGSLLKFQLVDYTGIINCNIWNPVKELIQEFSNHEGKVIQVLHAYTKSGFLEKIELHIGEKASINFSPKEKIQKLIPSYESLFSQIQELNEAQNIVNIKCIIKSSPQISFFTRDGRDGKVLKALITNQNSDRANATLVAWNEQVEYLRGIVIGDTLQLLNVKVKKGLDDMIEVHAGKNSVIKKI